MSESESDINVGDTLSIDYIETDERVSHEVHPDIPYLTFEQKWDTAYPRDWHGNGQHILNEWNKNMPLERSLEELTYVLPNITVWWTSPTTARVIQTHEVDEELEALMNNWGCRVDGEFAIARPIDSFLDSF